MMSQQRGRKAGGVLPSGRGRVAITKASGDSGLPSQPTQAPTSKSKIPKSLRYDLENALVGLCDVWFEEIKPHLVQNNIKVHAHFGGDGSGPRGGDHRRLPPEAPGCSHLDPALSANDCQLCQLLCNAANSIESAVSQAASALLNGFAPVEAPLRPSDSDCQPCRLLCNAANSIESAVLKVVGALLNGFTPAESPLRAQIPCRSYVPQQFRPPRRNCSRRRHQTPPRPSKILRLCRTYSVLPQLPPTAIANPPRRTCTVNPKIHRYYTKLNLETANKYTQTPAYHPLDVSSKRQRGCHPVISENCRQTRYPVATEKSRPLDARSYCIARENSRHLDARSTRQCARYPASIANSRPPNPISRGQQCIRFSVSDKSRPLDARSYAVTPEDSRPLDARSSRLCIPCPAATDLSQRSRHQTKAFPNSPLYPEDIIDIIAEKQIKLLYQSPRKQDSELSMINTMAAKAALGLRKKKNPPWR